MTIEEARKEMFDTLCNYCTTILGFIFVCAVVTILLISGSYAIHHIQYKLDNRMCEVLVDNQVVYQGKSYFINLESVGQNGQSKKLDIYDGLLKVIPRKTYVNTNIVINDIN